MGHAVGDWNADGLMDWFSSAISHNGTDCAVSGCTFGFSGNKLYRNLGSRMFDDATNQVKRGLIWCPSQSVGRSVGRSFTHPLTRSLTQLL